MAALKVKIVFIVLCFVFSMNFSESGKFKIPKIMKKKSSKLPSTLQAAPSYQNIAGPSEIPLKNLQRRPAHSSMSDISLYAKPSSSSTSLNIGQSPSILKESESLHKQAALALNAEKLGLIPKKRNEQLKLIASITKNAAIGISAIGGSIIIGKTLSSDKVNETKNHNINDKKFFFHSSATPVTTTTTTDEISFRLKDK